MLDSKGEDPKLTVRARIESAEVKQFDTDSSAERIRRFAAGVGAGMVAAALAFAIFYLQVHYLGWTGDGSLFLSIPTFFATSIVANAEIDQSDDTISGSLLV